MVSRVTKTSGNYTNIKPVSVAPVSGGCSQLSQVGPAPGELAVCGKKDVIHEHVGKQFSVPRGTLQWL